MKKLVLPLFLALLLALTACAAPAAEPEAEPVPTAYQLKAGERLELIDVVFPEEVVITADPAGTLENRSEATFVGCTFEKGLKIIGDRSALIFVEEGCSFGAGSGVTAVEATPGSTKNETAPMEADFVKLFLWVDGVSVSTKDLFTTLCYADHFILNGTTHKRSDYPGCDAFLVSFLYENGVETLYTEAWTE